MKTRLTAPLTVWCGLMFGLMGWTETALGQAKSAVPLERTPLRPIPSKDTESKEPEEAGLGPLLKEVTTLSRHVSIGMELLAKSAQANDGTPEASLRGNTVGLLVGRDEARLRSKVAASVEAARHETAEQLSTLQGRSVERQLAVKNTQDRVQELADRVVAQRAKAEAPMGLDQIELEADEQELLGVARLAAAQQADAGRLERMASRCEDDLKAFELVDARLAAMRRVQRVETERRIDALRNETQVLETQELLERGKALAEIVQALGGVRGPHAGEVPASSGVMPISPTSPLGEILKGSPKPMAHSDEDRRLLDTVLREAIERRQKASKAN